MKEYYQITEIARLYGICADTLRYYEEQGLIHPKRSEAGYRLYSIDDICNLNVIRALRALDMPVEQMRDYFSSRSIRSTLGMLDGQEEIIRSRIAQLREVQRAVDARRTRLRRYSDAVPGVLSFAEFSDRPCLQLQADVIMESEIDFALKKLAHRHENVLRALGTQCMGAVLDDEERIRGVFNHFRSVFYLGCTKRESDGCIPAGTYASMFYRGEYSQLGSVCTDMIQQLRERGMRPDGPVMELYHIDAHDSADVGEYLTEVQLCVVPAVSKAGITEGASFHE